MEKRMYSGLYEIVDLQCTEPQIKALLSRYRYLNNRCKEEVRLGGNKSDLISNLRRVVSLGIIPKDDVYDLVRDAEENGRQHIFLFKPMTREDRELISDGTRFATAVFEEEWGPDYFPKFERQKESYTWVDFRLGIGRKSKDWVAKMYGHEAVYRVSNRWKEKQTALGYNQVIEYKRTDYSTVLMLRWNNPQILEVRIDQTGNVNALTIPDRHDTIIVAANEALRHVTLAPYSLSNAVTKMLLERKEFAEAYSIGYTRLKDAKNGFVDFHPYDPDETIDAEMGRSEAINKLIEAKAKGFKSAILWKRCDDTPDDFPDKGLLTTVTGDFCNELIVGSRTSAAAIDYVTNRLRDLT